MGMIDNLQSRIEMNAVKSELSWTDISGKVHVETVFLKRSRLPFIGDWGRIYPPLNEDKTINWSNLLFGGKKNLLKLIFIMILIAFVLFEYFSFVGDAREYLDGRNYVIVHRTLFDEFCSPISRDSEVKTTFIDSTNSTMTIFDEMS